MIACLFICCGTLSGCWCAGWLDRLVLCRLTCASLAEDRYGVVQRDIPKIIEALLSFLTAIEDYQAELQGTYAMPPPERMQELSVEEVQEQETLAMEAARASEVLSVVGDGECLRFSRLDRTGVFDPL